MQQAGGYKNVVVNMTFLFCNIQCNIEDSVNMLFVMGAVLHAFEHIFFYKLKICYIHVCIPFYLYIFYVTDCTIL